ncbi:MAG TPA: carboxymuconolactone decarboxylase family protein [Novosphingobium sp.]
MTHDWPQRTRKLAAAIKEVRLGAHDVAEALAAIGGSATGAEAMDPRTRELVAVAIAAALRSPGWMSYCAELAARAGVAREQLVEAMGLVVTMGGSLTLAEAGQVLDSFDRLAAAD